MFASRLNYKLLLFFCWLGLAFCLNARFHSSDSMIKFKDWHLLAGKSSNHWTLCERLCSYYVQIMVVFSGKRVYMRRVMAAHSSSAWARDSPEPCKASIVSVDSWAGCHLQQHWSGNPPFLPLNTFHAMCYSLPTGQQDHGEARLIMDFCGWYWYCYLGLLKTHYDVLY